MGSAISKAANGIGGVVGNVVSAPFKSIFGESCENICAGPWDALCFIEHLCVTNLVKLLLILGLCYIGFLFFYISFQLGICQCIGRSLCSMCWAACDGYWHGLKYITCFCWYKLKNTKRVYRHKGGRRRRRRQPRFSDIESSESESSNNQPSISRKRKSVREGRKAQITSSRHFSHRHRHHRHHHHYSGSRGISFRVKSGSDRLKINSRKLHEMNVKNHKRNFGSSKRRRLK